MLIQREEKTIPRGRLTRRVPRSRASPIDGGRWSTRRALISRGAIKVCSSSRWRKEKKKKRKFPPLLPFIGSVYTRARHRVISLFLSQAGVRGRGTLLLPGLAFAPPFVFIRGSRGTLTATCRLPNPPFQTPVLVFTGTGLVSFWGRGRRRTQGWKRLFRRKRRGKKWHACHTSRFPWLRYFLATRIYYSHPSPPRLFLSFLLFSRTWST